MSPYLLIQSEAALFIWDSVCVAKILLLEGPNIAKGKWTPCPPEWESLRTWRASLQLSSCIHLVLKPGKFRFPVRPRRPWNKPTRSRPGNQGTPHPLVTTKPVPHSLFLFTLFLNANSVWLYGPVVSSSPGLWVYETNNPLLIPCAQCQMSCVWSF